MARYAARRLALLLPVVLSAAVVTFALLLLLPGDPAVALLGQEASPEELSRFRHLLGLDRPVLVQLGLYLWRVARADFGRSITLDVPVLRLILSTLPATLELATASIVVAVLAGIPLGLLAARRRGTVVDTGTMLLAQLGVSMPVFWLGVLLILLFAVRLNWLPSFGRGAPLLEALLSGDLSAALDSLRHLLLPTVTLAFFNLALLSRLTRWALLEVLEEDYVRTARAKGQHERVVVFRHALRNALLPIVTIVGLQFGNALGGAVVTETIYGWPGMGRLVVQAIGQRDFPVVQGAVLILALVFSLFNLLVDLTYAFIDPRIRYE
ncbi:MAG: ABC transporter permease [Armatimonadota bacterium]|nr:ABC transporter permease [Armatimonadota bacterium]MDR7450813.1 ABC transporter permease [Armatimonadota bacterium]MDR7466169.1 ABC transporter permease [Armatimonadota bacterium]MDR7493794.1 ABC transporter permease [Armatimonadota bacterium]MDR7499045.1 ABC transporter permease [Armatimonadota bacterium]